MNVQIFGTKKCNDTKKAERFFKERGIKFQFIKIKKNQVINHKKEGVDISSNRFSFMKNHKTKKPLQLKRFSTQSGT